MESRGNGPINQPSSPTANGKVASMNQSLTRLLFWGPRGLTILFILFLGLFALTAGLDVVPFRLQQCGKHTEDTRLVVNKKNPGHVSPLPAVSAIRPRRIEVWLIRETTHYV